MYQLNYNQEGKVSSIKRISDSASIPLCEGNMDYQAFLKWNKEQAVPLDLNSVDLVIKAATETAQANANTLANFAAIDLKSIRSIREYLAAKPDAPAYLKIYEAQAIAERAVIIK